MRNPVLILTSVGLNIAFAAAWIFSHNSGTDTRLINQADAAQNSTNQVKAVPYYRKQLFSWHEVESDDYPTYVSNLRDIGCPEDTIRDIIVADVNELYARKKSTEIITTNQQWWRSEPDTNVATAASEKNRALDEERRALLTRLLGPNWENPEVATAPKPRIPWVLDGPALGSLPDETKESVQQIAARSQQRVQAYLDSRRALGKGAESAELSKLRQQTRAELAAVLPPAQLEEFLLRYSESANNLRKQLGDLKYFNTSPDEFKNIFRATDQIGLQLELLAGKTDPNSVQQRTLLEQQREFAIKNTLGPQRYAEYRRLQDPAYRDAYASGQQLNAPQAVPVLAEINQATADERARINGDTNLTAEQKAIELKRAELEQLKAQSQVAGKELPASETPPPLPLPPKQVHTISAGESVATVSLLYGVGITAIREANPGVDFSKLKPGDSIFVPKSQLTR